ncbi:hypothetical protein GCM10023149_29770 [Mucilaginibacter gynuensis]|uniref:Pectate lyase-like protein n=1 Tax=Mucilaginibacter gynuensis TaxID=1302236 RepID=A0ABP8GM30_9SPHI
MRRIGRYLLFVALLSSAFSCKKVIQEKIYVTEDNDTSSQKLPEYVITNYGAKGDGKTDCSVIINNLISRLPASGGTIVIPDGDFLLNSSIIVNRNFVTIRGLNAGLRSNVDVPPSGIIPPGGGSKLLLGTASIAVSVPALPDVNGRKNRVSGLIIKNLLISGGTTTKGTGISVVQDNDGVRIEDFIGINLNTGIYLNAADAAIIRYCWISECRNSIEMPNGIQNMISNCQLGAQPGGITVKLTNQENFIFTANHVYPDGDVNLQVNNSRYGNISSNNFQSYYVGVVELNSSSNNLINGNLTWMKLPGSPGRQLRGQDNDYGVFRINGDYNMVSNNTINCDWAASSADAVTVRSESGLNNRFQNIKISDTRSPRVFLVNSDCEIFNCVPAPKVIQGDASTVYIQY